MGLVEVRSTRLHGHEVSYRYGGSGPALVFVHGMAGSSITWAPVLEAFARTHTVIAPDLPGHGHSAKPRGDYSLGAAASFLRDLMSSLGHERATIIGQSLGGGIAMQFAYQHPEQCERLVLVSSGGLGEEVALVLRLFALPGSELIAPLLFLPFVRDGLATASRALAKIGLRPSPEVIEMWRSYGSLVQPDCREAFIHTLRSVIDVRGQRINAQDRLYLAASMPTLIVWGDADHIIPVSHGLAAHEAIPGSQLEVFEGVGHFPHCDEPDRFVDVVDEFIATNPAVRLSAEEWRQRLAVVSA